MGTRAATSTVSSAIRANGMGLGQDPRGAVAIGIIAQSLDMGWWKVKIQVIDGRSGNLFGTHGISGWLMEVSLGSHPVDPSLP